MLIGKDYLSGRAAAFVDFDFVWHAG